MLTRTQVDYVGDPRDYKWITVSAPIGNPYIY